MRFIIEQSDETLTTHSGLSLVGLLLDKTNLGIRLNQTIVPGVSTRISRIVMWPIHTSVYFARVRATSTTLSRFVRMIFFAALQIANVPSSPTLRQRFDMAAPESNWESVILEESANLLHDFDVTVSPVHLGQDKERSYVPLDIDVSPFDNSGTKKQGVSRTYKGHDGYAPIFAYLGLEGYAVHVNLREGSTHCQKGTAEFLAESIRYAKRITSLPLLLRLDAGNDSVDNLVVCRSEELVIWYIHTIFDENPL